MAWNDPYETFVGATGQIYTADVGTAFPAAFAVPGASWSGLGYASEDGLSESHEITNEDLGAWQSFGPIRRVKTGETFTIGAALLQHNEVTVIEAFGGGTLSSISGGYEYTPPAPEEGPAERAVIADVFDGDRQLRILVKRATITGATEVSFTRGAYAELPVSFGALQPDDGSSLFTRRYSDSAAFVAGS